MTVPADEAGASDHAFALLQELLPQHLLSRTMHRVARSTRPWLRNLLLRSVLRTALEQLKPAGERKYTGEWLLYNILDMKFMEGKKVREIALKLAVSEADLYRKQKVAIEKIADILVQMEMRTTGREPD